MTIYDEVWAVDAERIKSFFKDYIEDVDHSEDVTVIPLPGRMLGPLTMPQTRIIIRGNHADELYRDFYLHFMAAGG